MVRPPSNKFQLRVAPRPRERVVLFVPGKKAEAGL